LHGTGHNRLDHGHIDQEHSPIEDPTVSGCQNRPTPAPRQVAHQGQSSVEVLHHMEALNAMSTIAS